MCEYKIHTEDGKLFVSDYHGGFVIGDDSGYTWKSKSKAEDAIKRCQHLVNEKLILEAA